MHPDGGADFMEGYRPPGDRPVPHVVGRWVIAGRPFRLRWRPVGWRPAATAIQLDGYGRFFDPRDPDPRDVDARDLAAILSRTPRYGGVVGWSVAEHSLLVAGLAPPELRLKYLIHDGGEALSGFGDIASPVKYARAADGSYVFAAVLEHERRVQEAVYRAFGVDPAPDAALKEADRLVAWAEALALLPGGFSRWPEANRPPAGRLPEIRRLARRVVPGPPEDAEAAFLAKFYEYRANVDGE